MVTSRAFSGRLVPETFHDWQKREGFILSQALKSFGPSFYRNQSGVEFGVSDAVVGIHLASISVLFSLISNSFFTQSPVEPTDRRQNNNSKLVLFRSSI